MLGGAPLPRTSTGWVVSVWEALFFVCGDVCSTCSAASACDTLTSGVYTDWYLPSKDVLDMMYVNLHLQGLGGFTTNGHYWSSTEFDSYRAWFENFNYGLQNTTYTTMSFWVRAVRAF